MVDSPFLNQERHGSHSLAMAIKHKQSQGIRYQYATILIKTDNDQVRFVLLTILFTWSY